MNRRSGIFILFAILVAAVAAGAHPLGNFSINQFSHVETNGSKIKIRQALEMAEIPVFQAFGAIDTDLNGVLSPDELDAYTKKITAEYVANLRLVSDGEVIGLYVERSDAQTQNGEGNLPTLKVTWDLGGDLPSGRTISRVEFENTNYSDRIGWNEIVVTQGSGVTVYDSNVFGSGLSDELRTYPKDSLSSPLNERSAAFSITTEALREGARPLQDRDGANTAAPQKDRLAELISVPEITPMVALFGLLIAFGLGGVHAMSPGHGKTVVGAYLVGSRGSAKHAMFLGLTVTVTHTLG
ncbi:MAG: hypothetical protein ABIV21_05275, partial [Pyrinomonadaceae bacterium]